MISTVTGKRQLTVPARIARLLSICAGTQVEWITGDKPGEVLLKVKPSRAELLRRLSEIGRKYSGTGEDACAILERERALDDAGRSGVLYVAEEKPKYRVAGRKARS